MKTDIRQMAWKSRAPGTIPCMRVLAILVAVVLMVMGPGAGRCRAASPTGLFIYWRGETDCGRGMKAELAARGVRVTIDEFNANQDTGRLRRFVAGLDERWYDFIYTFGTTVSLAVAAKVTKTPIVFGIVASPMKVGLIGDWHSSGRNITGISHMIPYQDQIKLILQLGAVSRVGILYNNKEKNSLIAKTEMEKGLADRGVSVCAVAVSSEAGIDRAVEKIIAQRPHLVYLPSDSFIISHTGRILPRINAARIPTYGAVEQLVKSGAMVGIVASYSTVGRKLASKVERICNGIPPERIPSEQLPPDMQTILVNATTAKGIGAKISYEILSLGRIIRE